MKILVLPKYHAEGSSSRYRYYNYFEYFLKENLSVTCRPLLYDGYVHDLYKGQKKIKRIWMKAAGIVRRTYWLLLNKKKFDIIIIEKELVTFMPFLLEKMLLKGSKFILDYDDNINARYQSGIAKNFLSKKIRKLGALANGITAGNHWYLDFYKNIQPSKIHYLPTVIDRNLYQSIPYTKQDDKPVTIIWIGSPSTAKYLKAIDDLLARLQSTFNCTIKIIGADIPLKCKAVYEEWKQDSEITSLQQADIGIMPQQNNEWEKGKCGLKLIQYMGCGLPVVASDVVASREIIDSETGFIARTDDEWFIFLSNLLASAALRNQLGEKGKAKIYQHYSYQVWAPVFLRLIKEAANRKA